MNYQKTKIQNGITIHTINTDKFKTNIVSIFLTTRLNRENITKEALLPAVLRLGTKNVDNQKELSRKLEEMYGANFNCGIEKIGDNHVLKFYIETIEDKYTLNKENILEQSLNFLFDIVFNPLVENNSFRRSYVLGEKDNLKKIIDSKIDNKRNYSLIRCIEEMYKNKEYGLFEYGYTEDLKDINEKSLYEFYLKYINNCKIDIYVSGKFDDENKVNVLIKNNELINKLQPRDPDYSTNGKEIVDNIETTFIQESMNVTQGNLTIGLSIKDNENKEPIINVYSAILGGGSNSKLFQNVREKASLAYTAGSLYIRSKNNIIVRCGIEIKNYDKALDLIKKQLEDIKNGDFSEKDIQDAKELILAGLSSINEEQGTEIAYNITHVLQNDKTSIEDYKKLIMQVNKNDIMNLASNVIINTVYFLKN